MILQFLMSLAAGLFAWTFLEYVIHYWLGHLPKGKTLISREHIAHHKDVSYFSPLPLKIRGAMPVLAIVGGLGWWLGGPAVAAGLTLAVAAGWATYEGLHKSIHVNGPKTAYARWAARNHLYHHYCKPNRNHGVTSPIWDLVLGTYDSVKTVSLRERDVPDIPWLARELTKPETEQDQFTRGFQIRT